MKKKNLSVAAKYSYFSLLCLRKRQFIALHTSKTLLCDLSVDFGFVKSVYCLLQTIDLLFGDWLLGTTVVVPRCVSMRMLKGEKSIQVVFSRLHLLIFFDISPSKDEDSSKLSWLISKLYFPLLFFIECELMLSQKLALFVKICVSFWKTKNYYFISKSKHRSDLFFFLSPDSTPKILSIGYLLISKANPFFFRRRSKSIASNPFFFSVVAIWIRERHAPSKDWNEHAPSKDTSFDQPLFARLSPILKIGFLVYFLFLKKQFVPWIISL